MCFYARKPCVQRFLCRQRSSYSPSRHRSISSFASAIIRGSFTFALLYFYRQVAPLQLVKNKSSACASEQRSPPRLRGVKAAWNCNNDKQNHWYGELEWCTGLKNRSFLRLMKDFLIYKSQNGWIDNIMNGYFIFGPIETPSVHGANFGHVLFFRENWP